MANIVRRETPLASSLFRKNFGDLFDSFFNAWTSPLQEFSNSLANLAGGIPLDVIDRGDAYIVKASLPGVQKNDIDIEITDNVLTIKGTFNSETKNENERYLLQERRTGTFTRSLSFGEELASDKVTAQFKDGILEITIPKSEPIMPKMTKVNIA